MQALLDDLTDFNRTNLGLGINVRGTSVNLADVLADELDELRAVNPDKQIELQVSGNLQGVWDGRRLQQLLGNLVINAIKYGAHDASVRVVVSGKAHHGAIEARSDETETVFSVSLPRVNEPQ